MSVWFQGIGWCFAAALGSPPLMRRPLLLLTLVALIGGVSSHEARACSTGAEAIPSSYMTLYKTWSNVTGVPWSLLAFDPVRDFAPISRVGSSTFMLLVSPASVFEAIVPFLILLSCALLVAQPAAARAVERRGHQGRPGAVHADRGQRGGLLADQGLQERVLLAVGLLERRVLVGRRHVAEMEHHRLVVAA